MSPLTHIGECIQLLITQHTNVAINMSLAKTVLQVSQQVCICHPTTLEGPSMHMIC